MHRPGDWAEMTFLIDAMKLAATTRPKPTWIVLKLYESFLRLLSMRTMSLFSPTCDTCGQRSEHHAYLQFPARDELAVCIVPNHCQTPRKDFTSRTLQERRHCREFVPYPYR